jgi:N6-adenosine-specific RNA methylase IME4
MIDREKYIDDYGLQIDPLFDIVDDAHAEIEKLKLLLKQWHDGWKCGHNQNCTSPCYDADRKTCEILELNPLNWNTTNNH